MSGDTPGARSLWATFLPASAVRFCSVLFLGLLIMRERRRLDAEDEVRRLAFTDELSGLANRRAFYLHLNQAWEQWTCNGEPFSVMIVDIDRFKSINDRFGHAVGDEVINAFGALLREVMRTVDVSARMGGEEFAIPLLGTNSTQTAVAAERLRIGAETIRSAAAGVDAVFTVSIGISSDAVDHLAAQDALSCADRALFEAKNSGRNRTVASPTLKFTLGHGDLTLTGARGRWRPGGRSRGTLRRASRLPSSPLGTSLMTALQIEHLRTTPRAPSVRR